MLRRPSSLSSTWALAGARISLLFPNMRCVCAHVYLSVLGVDRCIFKPCSKFKRIAWKSMKFFFGAGRARGELQLTGEAHRLLWWNHPDSVRMQGHVWTCTHACTGFTDINDACVPCPCTIYTSACRRPSVGQVFTSA